MMAGNVLFMSRKRAADKVARMLSGDLSDQEAREINAWTAKETENQQEFLETVHLLATMESLADDPEIRAIAQEPLTANISEKVEKNWPAFAAAAGFMLAAVVGLNTFMDRGFETEADTNMMRYVTRVGEQKTVDLADGSVVTLNTDSVMLVDINDTQRSIILKRGEAYFDVAQQPDLPFTVNVGVQSITVMGTEFNILKAPKQFTLSVLEGLVSIHEKEVKALSSSPELTAPLGESREVDMVGQHLVKAGAVVQYDIERKKVSVSRPKDLDNLFSWRKGWLMFEEATLSEVVEQLNRYSGKEIIIEDPMVRELKIFAHMRVDRIDSMLRSLEKVLPVKIEQHFDRVVIGPKME